MRGISVPFGKDRSLSHGTSSPHGPSASRTVQLQSQELSQKMSSDDFSFFHVIDWRHVFAPHSKRRLVSPSPISHLLMPPLLPMECSPAARQDQVTG